jgi:hypothetical protein
MSHFGANSVRCKRKASRIRRLIRFRSTDPPIARGTVSPNLAPVREASVSGRARQKAANIGLVRRTPLSYTFLNSADRKIRDDRVKERAPPAGGSTGFRVTNGSFVADRQLVAAAGPAAR